MSFVSQIRRMIEMAERTGKPEIAERLREILAETERVALLLAEGVRN